MASWGVGGADARAFLERMSTPLVGALVALLAWAPRFESPSFGLDPSWQAGLFMAVDQGLEFGTDAVFTYGPLGFLDVGSATVWFGDLAVLAWVYQSILFVALCVSLVWALRRSVGLAAAAVLSWAALAIGADVEVLLVIVLIWALAALGDDPPRHALDGLLAGGATLAAVGTLIKLSVGPIVLAVCIIALIGARASLARVAMFVGLFVVELLLLWALAGGGLGALADYVANGREIVSGYSEAMGITVAESWLGVAELASALALVAAAAALARGDLRSRIAQGLIAAIVAFALFKQGTVRLGAENLTIFFSTVLLLWLVLPWRGLSRVGLVAGAVALGALSAHTQLGDPFDDVNPVENARAAFNGARTAAAPASRETMTEGARALMQDAYALDPEIREAIGERPIAIDPWEIGVAWAYELNWSPLPVLQNYAAYTEALDELNADRVRSPEGPELILRHELPAELAQYAGRAIDGRFAGWDPPAQALATLCNFAPVRTTDRWQLLERTEDRCGTPELLETVDSSYGETVEVPEPAPDEVVIARVEGVEPGLAEKAKTLLFRAGTRTAELTGGGTYRVVPGTAGDGLLLRGPEAVIGTGVFAQAPQSPTIEITGADGPLRYEFYAVPVAVPDPEKPRPGKGEGVA